MRGCTQRWNYAVAVVWRRGRVAEGTSLLRKHMGLNLYREFESHRLRQFYNCSMKAHIVCIQDSKGSACKLTRGTWVNHSICANF